MTVSQHKLDPDIRPARDERGRLLPGSTANPNGAPKRSPEFKIAHVRELSEEFQHDPLRYFYEIATDPSALAKDRWEANKILLEYSRPKARTEVHSINENVESSTEGYTTEQLDALLANLD